MPYQPTPPPKQAKFGFPHKPSFSSFVLPRQNSVSNLRSGSVSNLSPRGRPSESHSLAESYISAQSETSQAGSSSGPRKMKSSFTIIPRMIKKRSQSRLTADSSERNSTSSPTPPVPYLDPSASYTSTSFASYQSTATASPSVSSSRLGKVRGKQKITVPPAVPPKDEPREPELTLDTNLEEMEGIIDLTARPSSSNDPLSSSPGSGFESSFPSSSFDHGGGGSLNAISTSPPTSIFSNPFLPPSSTVIKQQRPERPPHHIHEKVSPKTQHPPAQLGLGALDAPDAALWEAPESWAVERDGEDPAEPPDYSSSDESLVGGRPISMGPPPHCVVKKNKQRHSTRPKPPPKTTRQTLSGKAFKVRIYRANNTYHVASIGLTVTVADLTPVLNNKLLQESERESHRLYLKERGRGVYA